MTEQEREALRVAVERDVNLVLAACLPTYMDFASNVVEPKEATGCIHPVDMLAIQWDDRMMPPESYIRCACCDTVLDRELVRIRLEAVKNQR